MRLLLDTHVALWAIVDSPRLPQSIRSLLLASENTLVVSAASVWEIAIKHSLRRRDMPLSGETALRYFQESGYMLLSVGPGHAAAVEGLPDHHRDPFDRLLAAQALTEPLRLVTHDPVLAQYQEGALLF
ncbi:MAG: type II toxin-antitoxin system VapC family toxin [Gammaproteobacteria bacterium]|nr:type II toxin-antitoxin system VapC family toxin [Gammaproteobacteria bacterium]